MGSLVVFSDDWGRHPSSCQHLVEQLLGDYDVLWVNTIGTRTPKLDRATMSRVVAKVSQWSRLTRTNGGPRENPPVRVASPLMWPWFGRRLDRWLNQQVLGLAVARAVRSLPRPRCAITTIPLVADLVGQIDVDAWIYYCVDDLASWPGLDGKTLARMEGELITKVDRLVTVSEYLQRRLESMGQDSTLVTHGVDLQFWQQPNAKAPSLDSIDNREVPWVVFWGLIDDRLDADWLLQLADRMERGTIVLAGPVQSPDPRLVAHGRTCLPGPLNYSELPGLARRASVLVMPYRAIPATLAMQPLKLKEYMMTGLPCVVSRLPATEAWCECLDVADDSDDFIAKVLQRLDGTLPESQSIARRPLQHESWRAKAEQFKLVIELAVKSCKPCPN
jgi:glycosyltransferase involved in cell wall biosynthesis